VAAVGHPRAGLGLTRPDASTRNNHQVRTAKYRARALIVEDDLPGWSDRSGSADQGSIEQGARERVTRDGAAEQGGRHRVGQNEVASGNSHRAADSRYAEAGGASGH
jgi:hypothetical protein